MHSECYGTWFVCVSVLEQTFIRRNFSSFESYGVIFLPMTSYEGTVATFCALFQWQSLLRVLKWLTID